MRFTAARLAQLRTAALAVFIAGCAVIFGWLWTNSGGKIPFLTPDGYDVEVVLADADNLSLNSDIRSAGVKIGSVGDLAADGDMARATLVLDDMVLHEGATVRLRPKTMLEETYVEIVDGNGPEIPEGSELPPESVTPSVQIDALLNAMDPATRDAFGNMITSLDPATAGTSEDLSALVQGLGDLGRDGTDALDVLAAQGEELRSLVREATSLVEVLDSGNGQIADLVIAAQQLNEVTANHELDLASTFEGLPGLVSSAQTAAPAITRLSTSLAPISASLRSAAPDLSTAIDELAATTPVLRGLLPELDVDLDLAPDTLNRLPQFTTPTRALLEPVDIALADLNPMLAYIEPYGPDIASFYTNFSNTVALPNEGSLEGAYARFFALYNEQTPTIFSTLLPSAPHVLTGANPYPDPVSMEDPQPFDGEYPRVEEGE